MVRWVAISLATDCTRLLPTTGGGKGCIQMPSTMLGTVQNEQLSQEEDNNIGPHFTQSQCNDPSKSLVLILWIYPEPSKGTNMSVFQDFFTKWPMVYPVPDQKALRIAQLFAEEIVPFFGVPEALLSDRGTNLLSHLVLDICKLLGVKKLNTTSYHPQCDGTVKRFNRTLKTMLRKQFWCSMGQLPLRCSLGLPEHTP